MRVLGMNGLDLRNLTPHLQASFSTSLFHAVVLAVGLET